MGIYYSGNKKEDKDNIIITEPQAEEAAEIKSENTVNIADNDIRQRIYNKIKEFKPYLYIAGFMLFAFTLIDPAALKLDVKIIEFYTLAIVIALIAFLATALYYKKITPQKAVMLIIIIGLVMRVAYALYTPYGVRQHDLGGFFGKGHDSYIYYIMTKFSLPADNVAQFYQPPLHHFLAAVWGKILTLFGASYERAFEGIQMLTMFYSAAVMVISYRIFKLIKLSDNAMILAMSIICLHPSFFIIGGSINNDMLMILFGYIIVLYTIRWYNEPNIKNTVVLAVALGLCMMAKTAGIIFAVVIAIVFIIKWINLEKPFTQRALFGKFALFGGISIPLGMWYFVRNLIMFKQPFGYIQPIPKSMPDYIGMHNPIERYFTIPLQQFTGYLYCKPIQGDYNIYAYILKCSVFGEFSYGGVDFQARMLLIFNILVVLLSLASLIYIWLYDKREETYIYRLILTLVWAAQMISYIFYTTNQAYSCAMDFRFLVPAILTGCAFLGYGTDVMKQNHNKIWKIIRYPVYATVAGFCLSSIFMYLSI